MKLQGSFVKQIDGSTMSSVTVQQFIVPYTETTIEYLLNKNMYNDKLSIVNTSTPIVLCVVTFLFQMCQNRI